MYIHVHAERCSFRTGVFTHAQLCIAAHTGRGSTGRPHSRPHSRSAVRCVSAVAAVVVGRLPRRASRRRQRRRYFSGPPAQSRSTIPFYAAGHGSYLVSSSAGFSGVFVHTPIARSPRWFGTNRKRDEMDTPGLGPVHGVPALNKNIHYNIH